MHSSSLAASIATADPSSPVVTPAQLAAFGEALLIEIDKRLAAHTPTTSLTSTLDNLKAYSTIADLRRATGLSRERISRIIQKHPEIRTITSDTYSYFRRIHTQDFLTTISNLSTPNKNPNRNSP